jgi:mitogen-activated protein kinase 15
MDTDLHAAVRASILEPVHKQYVMAQLLRSLAHMHARGLLHRDVKPSNLLLNGECVVKLADFGLARSLAGTAAAGGGGATGPNEEAAIPGAGAASNPVLTDYVATRWYRAPEILLGSPRYTAGVDLWACGCILGELLTGRPVFPGSSTMNQLDRILELTGRPTQQDLDAVASPFAATMLESCSVTRAAKLHDLFPGATEEALDLLRRLLRFDPTRRLSAAEALRHPYVLPFRIAEDDALEAAIEASSKATRAGKSAEEASAEAAAAAAEAMAASPHPSASGSGSGSGSSAAAAAAASLAPIVAPIDDNQKCSIGEYRDRLYAEILRKKRELYRRMKEREARAAARQAQLAREREAKGAVAGAGAGRPRATAGVAVAAGPSRPSARSTSSSGAGVTGAASSAGRTAAAGAAAAGSRAAVSGRSTGGSSNGGVFGVAAPPAAGGAPIRSAAAAAARGAIAGGARTVVPGARPSAAVAGGKVSSAAVAAGAVRPAASAAIRAARPAPAAAATTAAAAARPSSQQQQQKQAQPPPYAPARYYG